MAGWLVGLSSPASQSAAAPAPLQQTTCTDVMKHLWCVCAGSWALGIRRTPHETNARQVRCVEDKPGMGALLVPSPIGPCIQAVASQHLVLLHDWHPSSCCCRCRRWFLVRYRQLTPIHQYLTYTCWPGCDESDLQCPSTSGGASAAAVSQQSCTHAPQNVFK